jgi:hypothetical protein
MLSRDDVRNGRMFVLKLWDAEGTPSQWAETLSGNVARRWYDIYRRSDWAALRREATGTFRSPFAEREALRLTERNRCVVIQTTAVTVGDLDAPPAVSRKEPLP